MSDVVPLEVISHIFTRLPVKSLLRFRCVSRPVKRIIDSPSFIKAHLRGQLLKPNSDLKLLIRHSNNVIINNQHLKDTLYSLDFTSIGVTQPQLLDTPFALRDPIQTFVFSLKLGLWKKCEVCCPYYLLKEETGTFAGGSLNLLAGTDPFCYFKNLIAFDLATETFHELAFPENFGTPLSLSVLEDCLCAGSTNTSIGNRVLDHVHIWVMKDYGRKESWVKLFSVEQLAGSQHFHQLNPIGSSLTGKDVLLQMNYHKFLWYNLDRKSVRSAKLGAGYELFKSFSCLGTLIPLYEGDNGNEII